MVSCTEALSHLGNEEMRDIRSCHSPHLKRLPKNPRITEAQSLSMRRKPSAQNAGDSLPAWDRVIFETIQEKEGCFKEDKIQIHEKDNRGFR